MAGEGLDVVVSSQPSTVRRCTRETARTHMMENHTLSCSASPSRCSCRTYVHKPIRSAGEPTAHDFSVTDQTIIILIRKPDKSILLVSRSIKRLRCLGSSISSRYIETCQAVEARKDLGLKATWRCWSWAPQDGSK